MGVGGGWGGGGSNESNPPTHADTTLVVDYKLPDTSVKALDSILDGTERYICRLRALDSKLSDTTNVDEDGRDEPDFTVEPAMQLVVEAESSRSLKEALEASNDVPDLVVLHFLDEIGRRDLVARHLLQALRGRCYGGGGRESL